MPQKLDRDFNSSIYISLPPFFFLTMSQPTTDPIEDLNVDIDDIDSNEARLDEDDNVSDAFDDANSGEISNATTAKSNVDAYGFRTVPRATIDLSSGIIMTIKMRMTLSDKDLQRYVSDHATKAMTIKFDMMLQADNVSFEQVYDFDLRSRTFQKELMRQSMNDVFDIRTQLNSFGGLIKDGNPKSLFDHFHELDVDTIASSNKFYNQFGQSHHQQNLLWSQIKLENSCDDDLREKVDEALLDYDSAEHGGPLYFILMLGLLTTLTDESTAILVTNLRSMTLQDDLFPGEDVDKAISVIRGVYCRLQICRAVPNDMITIVLSIFKSAGCTEFADIFKTIESSRRIGVKEINGIRLDDVKHYFRVAAENYKSFLGSGKWVVVKKRKNKTPSGFAALSDGSIDLSKVTCYGCGELGHFLKDCPHCKNLGKKDDQANTTGGGTQSQRVPRKRIPPKDGEPLTRNKTDEHGSEVKNDAGDVIIEHYCAKCRLWNRTHTTTQHRSREEVAAAAAGNNTAGGHTAFGLEGTTSNAGAMSQINRLLRGL